MWGLPSHCYTQEIGKKIGAKIGKVQTTEFFCVRRDQCSIVKAKVEVDVIRPLRKGIKIVGMQGEEY